MMDAGRHPLIEVLTCTEVLDLQGRQGSFRARVRENPRYVDASLCVACGECEEGCPQHAPNAFDLGLGSRKAIHRPFAQSVPSTYVIDRDTCLNEYGMLVCSRCADACPRHAIDHDMRATEREIEVGSVIVAAGFEEYDPRELRRFGYGISPDVLTALEFERLLNASGPTSGHLVRPSDGAEPRKIAFVQCVGSRGEGGRFSCSRFCCTNSLKDALLARQHGTQLEECAIYFTELRTAPKGCESFAQRVKAEPMVRLVRGRPSRIDEQDGRLTLLVEDTLEGHPRRDTVDMVVLASAAVPPAGLESLAERLGIDLAQDGYVATNGGPVGTSRAGVYIAGGVGGARTIPESVARASASAALAARHALAARVDEEQLAAGAAAVEPIDTGGPPRVGVFVCHCGVNIAGVVDVATLVERARALPDVVHASEELFACSEGSQTVIQEVIREQRLTRVVVAACTPRTHEPVFRAACEGVGLNAYLLEMANIRDQCSWVHASEPEAATRRAFDQLRMAIERARRLEPLHATTTPVTPRGLVIGGGVAGMACAAALGEQGIEVDLVESTRAVGGRLARPGLTTIDADGIEARSVLDALNRRMRRAKVRVHRSSRIEAVRGNVGGFEVDVAGARGRSETLGAGAIALAIGTDLFDPGERFGYGELRGVVTNQELEAELAKREPRESLAAAFIQCVGSRGDGGNAWCSSFCCPTTVRQALALSERGADVVVFHRGIRAADRGLEEEYRRAREAGVLFVRYEQDRPPEVLGPGIVDGVRVYDPLLDRVVDFFVDLVVLATGLVPREPAASALGEILKLPRSPEGFFSERHAELAPVETVIDGIFLCGTAGGPADVASSMSHGYGAASKMAALLSRAELPLDPAVAEIDAQLCRGCGRCAEICRFNAPSLVADASGRLVARIEPALCKGCGTCPAWCPTGAIRARHSTDAQIFAMVDAALARQGGPA